MVVIRLARIGKKGIPTYKITVADKAAKLTGRFIEKLGVFAQGKGPGVKNDKLLINLERFNHWVKLGAQPSPRLQKILATHPTSEASTPARVS